MIYKTKHKAKKSLGQNFLKSSIALRKIIEAGEISEDDIVLEIGPGKGILTEKLLEKAGAVIAIEKDKILFELLQEKFEREVASGSLVLVHEDILEFNPMKEFPKFFSGYPASHRHHSKNLESLPYKVIANIPYNITGAILKKFLSGTYQPERMVLMLQNEVAKRIIANDKKESILSISVKAYGEVRMIMKVPARYFSPAPKVDSVIITIKNISRKLFEENGVDEDNFWQIVKTGFAHKRKKLGGNLKNLLQKDSLTLLRDKRAENLTLLDWISLSR